MVRICGGYNRGPSGADIFQDRSGDGLMSLCFFPQDVVVRT